MCAHYLYRWIGVFALVIILAMSWIASAMADSYAYDSLGRLIVVTFSDGSYISYAYDSAGNRTIVTQTAAP